MLAWASSFFQASSQSDNLPTMPTSSPDRPSRFLNLPLEIRELIYRNVLSTESTKETSETGYARYKFDLNLFLINRQVHDESTHIFRRLYHFIRIQTPWPQAQQHVAIEGYVPIICWGRKAENFKNYHMLINIDTPEFPFATDMHSFVCLLDDLPLFNQMWYYSDLGHPEQLNPHLGLALTMQDPYVPVGGEPNVPMWLQRRLLNSFSLVKNLHTFNIYGPPSLSKTLQSDLKTVMNEPYESPEACLEKADKLKGQGNDASKRGDYQDAIKLYEAAFLAMHIFVKGRRRNVWADAFFHTELKGGTFDGQSGHAVRLLLRLRLVANTVLAYLKQGLTEEAKFWGMRTINLLRDSTGGEDVVMQGFIGSKEIGKIYYRTALAKKDLKDRAGARELIQVAAKYLPHDRIVREEMGNLALKLG